MPRLPFPRGLRGQLLLLLLGSLVLTQLASLALFFDAARAAIRARTLAQEPAVVTALIDDTGAIRASAMRRVGLHVTAGIPMRPHLPTAPLHLERALAEDYGWYAATEDLRRRRFEAWRADELAGR